MMRIKGIKTAGLFIVCFVLAHMSTVAALSAAGTTGSYEQQEMTVRLERIATQDAINEIAGKYNAVGVQVSVIRNGFIDETYVYGSATKNVEAMTDDTRILSASLSKVVLGMVAMGLHEDGVIDLDADIGLYWGEPVRNPNYAGRSVTIRSILSHTSSIKANESGLAKEGLSVRCSLRSGAAFNRSMPGAITSWCYNNHGFAVLGLTMELAAGETINSIADRKLFKPLGIRGSFGYRPVNGDRLATLYFHDGTVSRSVDAQKSVTANTSPGQSGMCFAGGLAISAQDLAKLVVVLVNDGVYEDQQVLSPESVAMMETVGTQPVPDQAFFQGLPMRRQAGIYGQKLLYYHTGSAYGVCHMMSYNPETKCGAVILTTGAGAARDSHGIYRICGEISEAVYPDDPPI